MLSPLEHLFWLELRESGYKMDVETFLEFKLRLYRLVRNHIDDVILEPGIYTFIIREFLENIKDTILKEKLKELVPERYESKITIWKFFEIFDRIHTQI